MLDMWKHIDGGRLRGNCWSTLIRLMTVSFPVELMRSGPASLSVPASSSSSSSSLAWPISPYTNKQNLPLSHHVPACHPPLYRASITFRYLCISELRSVFIKHKNIERELTESSSVFLCEVSRPSSRWCCRGNRNAAVGLQICTRWVL